jgi:hypothetical protein
MKKGMTAETIVNIALVVALAIVFLFVLVKIFR